MSDLIGCDIIVQFSSGQQRDNTQKMPPKKNNKREEKCPFYNRGFCKFKDDCKKEHPKEVCDENNCTEEHCVKRHPNPCKFGFRCVFKKKKICLYSHVTLACDDAKFNDEIQEITKKMSYLENLVKKEDSKYIDLGKGVDKRIEAFESQLKTIRKAIEDKNSCILSLEK